MPVPCKVTFWQFAAELRMKSQLCDVEFHVEDSCGNKRVLLAHKMIVMYYSGYLHGLLSRDSRRKVYQLTQMKHQALQSVIRLLYKEKPLAEFVEDKESVKAAEMLDLDLHDEVCNIYLRQCYQELCTPDEEVISESSAVDVPIDTGSAKESQKLDTVLNVITDIKLENETTDNVDEPLMDVSYGNNEKSSNDATSSSVALSSNVAPSSNVIPSVASSNENESNDTCSPDNENAIVSEVEKSLSLGDDTSIAMVTDDQLTETENGGVNISVFEALGESSSKLNLPNIEENEETSKIYVHTETKQTENTKETSDKFILQNSLLQNVVTFNKAVLVSSGSKILRHNQVQYKGQIYEFLPAKPEEINLPETEAMDSIDKSFEKQGVNRTVNTQDQGVLDALDVNTSIQGENDVFISSTNDPGVVEPTSGLVTPASDSNLQGFRNSITNVNGNNLSVVTPVTGTDKTVLFPIPESSIENDVSNLSETIIPDIDSNIQNNIPNFGDQFLNLNTSISSVGESDIVQQAQSPNVDQVINSLAHVTNSKAYKKEIGNSKMTNLDIAKTNIKETEFESTLDINRDELQGLIIQPLTSELKNNEHNYDAFNKISTFPSTDNSIQVQQELSECPGISTETASISSTTAITLSPCSSAARTRPLNVHPGNKSTKHVKETALKFDKNRGSLVIGEGPVINDVTVANDNMCSDDLGTDPDYDSIGTEKLDEMNEKQKASTEDESSTTSLNTNIILIRPSIPGVRPRSRRGPFTCEYCEKVLPSYSLYERHRRNHTGEQPFMCSICGKRFSRKGNLNVHLKLHEAEGRQFQCEVCDHSFKTQHSLKQHIKTVHKENSEVKCPECDKMLRSQSSLKQHLLNKHHGGEREECKICGRQFDNLTYLKRHSLTHTDDKPHKCEECGEEFRTYTRRKNHVATVHSNETYVCEVCGKSFNSKPVLNAHCRRLHGDAAKKDCPICHKIVANFHNHMRMHRSYEKGEVYTCTECSKTFPMKTYLQQHMNIHKNKKFHCDMCQKSFTFLASLKSHQKTCGRYQDIDNDLSNDSVMETELDDNPTPAAGNLLHNVRLILPQQTAEPLGISLLQSHRELTQVNLDDRGALNNLPTVMQQQTKIISLGKHSLLSASHIQQLVAANQKQSLLANQPLVLATNQEQVMSNQSILLPKTSESESVNKGDFKTLKDKPQDQNSSFDPELNPPIDPDLSQDQFSLQQQNIMLDSQDQGIIEDDDDDTPSALSLTQESVQEQGLFQGVSGEHVMLQGVSDSSEKAVVVQGVAPPGHNLSQDDLTSMLTTPDERDVQYVCILTE